MDASEKITRAVFLQKLAGIILAIGFVAFFAKNVLAAFGVFRFKDATTGTPFDYIMIDEITGVITIGKPGNLELIDGVNIITGTTTGSMLGATSSQKIGAWGVTPIVRPSAFTQTYSLTDKTHSNSTFGAISETAAALAVWGYTSAAQADSIPVELNDLGDDVIDLKKLVNSLIDDLQSEGWIQ